MQVQPQCAGFQSHRHGPCIAHGIDQQVLQAALQQQRIDLQVATLAVYWQGLLAAGQVGAQAPDQTFDIYLLQVLSFTRDKPAIYGYLWSRIGVQALFVQSLSHFSGAQNRHRKDHCHYSGQATMAFINVRIDADLKIRAYRELERLGVTPSELMRQALQYLAERRLLPLQPRAGISLELILPATNISPWICAMRSRRIQAWRP